jgi:hypothetical protein
LSPHNTIIIDDNHRVWNVTPDNVIVIKPYSGPQHDSEYTADTELLKVMKILSEIHILCTVSPELLSDIIKDKNIEYQKRHLIAPKTDITIIELLADKVLSTEISIGKDDAEPDDPEYWRRYDILHGFNEWYT